ncbi:diguanylate cyclase [Vagococcus sp. WN89Y]|uniref:diguanylate cyclase n=1 Tax=Vagococcus sp. WN89Y TaxID=3457258 RepID=UPI003FCEDCCE
MSGSDNINKKERIPGRRFVRRMYLMRILGTLLCFFPILSVLLELHRPMWLLMLLAVNAFIWPTLAFLRARHSPVPLHIEHQNLVFDAAVGGFWIALMACSPLPSVVIATILLSDRLSAGGIKLLRTGALTMALVFLLSWLALGLPVSPEVTQRTMYATLPLIAVYMLALSALTNGIASQLRVKSRKLERIAMMDPLLDIANRRLLEQRVQLELTQLHTQPRQSSLMYIDIDNFKEVNDKFGHKAGDALLVDISRILHVATRNTDTPARMGGDEFVILLPDTPPEEAKNVAQRIMQATAGMELGQEQVFRCTLSIGIASALPEMGSAAAWLKSADDALYKAKRLGKNQIYAH